MAATTTEDGLAADDTSRRIAIAELEQRAQAGDGAATCALGDHYRTGDIVSQDWSVAFRWYNLGAELGDRTGRSRSR